MKIYEDIGLISKIIFLYKNRSWRLEVAGSIVMPAKSSNFQLLSF